MWGDNRKPTFRLSGFRSSITIGSMGWGRLCFFVLVRRIMDGFWLVMACTTGERGLRPPRISHEGI
jgi:hypothetical protein